jgi:hypothetical protein
MAATITERPESRPFDVGPETGERHLLYDVAGTTDEVEVEALVQANIPAYYGGLNFQSYAVTPDGAPDIWKVDVKYGLKQKKKPGEWTMAFDTSGGTQKITQSRQTVDSRFCKTVSAGTFPPDFKGAINVTKDSVDGCEIAVSTFRYEESHVATDQHITADWIRLVRKLTGRTNDAPFRVFATGEVLFLGVSGTKRFEDNWELTFKFDVGENVTTETEPPIEIGTLPDPGDPGTRLTKMAHDYMWVRHEDVEDASSLVKQPHSVYVERVYLDGHFDDMFPWIASSNGVWSYAGQTSPPANGSFVTDAPAFVDVSVLDIAKLDADANDLSAMLAGLQVGDTIRIEDLADPSTKYVEYTVTALPNDLGSFFSCPVALVHSSPAPPTIGADCRISISPS